MPPWEGMTPKHRGELVRRNASTFPRLSLFGVCHLYSLNREGARKILAGGDWHPEFDIRRGTAWARSSRNFRRAGNDRA